MTNKEVCKAFVMGEDYAMGSNLSIRGNVLYSYATAICQRLGNDKFVYNETKYSSTTSRHQNCLRYALRGHEVETVSKISRGCTHLK